MNNHTAKLHVRLAAIILIAPLWLGISAAAETPPALLFYASQSGRQTLDAAEGGGNPFAGAFVELLSRPHLALDAFASDLVRVTVQKSQDFQVPDVPPQVAPKGWEFRPKRSGETRVGLVVVFSDYHASDGATSLPGAAHDANRVSAALNAVGFNMKTMIDPSRIELSSSLEQFAQISASSDFAVIYATGHGVEVNGIVYLLPGDYPVSEGKDALEKKAVPLNSIAGAARARMANLVFYGGCRDNPFELERERGSPFSAK